MLKTAAPGQYDSDSATAIAPEAGVRLQYFGDYELLEEIARGGMGVVFKARQTSLKRDVALKMIRAGALAGPDEVERFLREAEAAANLQHPNIVAIHEVGEHDGQHYFSMDYVAGRDLGALVKDGPLSPRRAARYVKIIAEAIQFAHQRGTLHRDLKPQNVLIDGADQPRITDFGLAKLMKDDSRLTQTGVVMGSPSYMPPEQAAGRHGDVGPASDVYSLGAMLYELLTGQPPFRGATVMATLGQVLMDEPAAPRRLNAAIPPDLETICLKCLEKSPLRRYATARDLADELDRFLKGEPIQARPASALRKSVSWARRHTGVLAGAAALVMVTLAFGVFYLFEENAFLRAHPTDADLARVPGALFESSQWWGAIGGLVVLVGLWLPFIVHRQARGLSTFKAKFSDFFDQAQFARPTQPLNERTRRLAIGGSLILIGYGVTLLALTIQAYVWEGVSIASQFVFIYFSIYLGFVTLGMLVRDYRLVQYGASSRQLTAEQLAPIQSAMEDWDVVAAIKLYRDAVPDASLPEASQYVTRLAESLRAQHPGKFVPPPLSLATLNWKAVLICAAIEAVVLGVLWIAMPPAYPAAAVVQFTLSLLFGMGLIAFGRVKGKRRRLFVAVVAIMSVGGPFMLSLLEAASYPSWLYFWGFFFGIFLMISAVTPRRRRRVSKV